MARRRRDPYWIDVTDRGAVGNDSTDCTDAIQAALDEALALGATATRRVTVYFPPGIYRHYGLYYTGIFVDLVGANGAWLKCMNARPGLCVGLQHPDGLPSGFNGWTAGTGGVPTTARPDAYGVMDSTWASAASPGSGSRVGLRSVADSLGRSSDWVFPVSPMTDSHPSRTHWMSRVNQWWLTLAVQIQGGGTFGNLRSILQSHGNAEPWKIDTDSSGRLRFQLRTANWSRFSQWLPTAGTASIQASAPAADGQTLRGLARIAIQYDGTQSTLASALSIWVRHNNESVYTKATLSTTNSSRYQAGPLAQNDFNLLSFGGDVSFNDLGSTTKDQILWGLAYGSGLRFQHSSSSLVRYDGNTSITDDAIFNPPTSGTAAAAFKLTGTDLRTGVTHPDRRWAECVDHEGAALVGMYRCRTQAAVKHGRIENLVLKVQKNGTGVYVKTFDRLNMHRVWMAPDDNNAYGFYKEELGTNSYPFAATECQFNGKVAAFLMASASSCILERCTWPQSGRAVVVLVGAECEVVGKSFVAADSRIENAVKALRGTQRNSLILRGMNVNMEGVGTLLGPLCHFEGDAVYGGVVYIDDVFTDEMGGQPVLRFDDITTGAPAYKIEMRSIRCNGASNIIQTNGPRARGYVEADAVTGLTGDEKSHTNVYGSTCNMAVRETGIPSGETVPRDQYR